MLIRNRIAKERSNGWDPPARCPSDLSVGAKKRAGVAVTTRSGPDNMLYSEAIRLSSGVRHH
jgi:ABC-type transporter Mla maintaining outer membrane lipid asymmetry ATPase subunit MlaF